MRRVHALGCGHAQAAARRLAGLDLADPVERPVVPLQLHPLREQR